ncbi:hypothetical protein CG91_gp067 [Mycobacterium phage 39HC]|uniref:hypothetical protein n=1 Tax=Mycobacterium phage 39HC TaxID=1463809 RepID=UPI0003F2111E|nr:hypothetical protein CG91_gp067 [Mycobacterium phage 39HC]AHJ88367.1 hypothetical protein 39HC_067 [Mycobacterium phage 39HC]AHJ88467.1 hypothetical protein 40BC_067 [Mycobacterium phage 40BC]
MSDQPVCPKCPHPVTHHTAHPPRTLTCAQCECVAVVKWRYAWAVTLLAWADRLAAWGRAHR